MSYVFQNIDHPSPSPPGECVPPPPLLRGEDTLAGWRGGWGVNILEDARHSSVLYLYRILFGIISLPLIPCPSHFTCLSLSSSCLSLSPYQSLPLSCLSLFPQALLPCLSFFPLPLSSSASRFPYSLSLPLPSSSASLSPPFCLYPLPLFHPLRLFAFPLFNTSPSSFPSASHFPLFFCLTHYPLCLSSPLFLRVTLFPFLPLPLPSSTI